MSEKEQIKFENKKVEFKIIKQSTNYFEMAKACLEAVKPEGITTGGMRIIFKTIDKLEMNEGKNDSVKLSKAEIQAILNSEKSMPWNIVDRQIVEFEDYLQKLLK